MQCSEQYNINVHQTLSSKHNYFLRYTYPDGTTADGSARLSSANLLTSQSPGEYAIAIKVKPRVIYTLHNVCNIYIIRTSNYYVMKM